MRTMLATHAYFCFWPFHPCRFLLLVYKNSGPSAEFQVGTTILSLKNPLPACLRGAAAIHLHKQSFIAAQIDAVYHFVPLPIQE
jgi:hypothetical protein